LKCSCQPKGNCPNKRAPYAAKETLQQVNNARLQLLAQEASSKLELRDLSCFTSCLPPDMVAIANGELGKRSRMTALTP
jgi:hypothetical protein